MKRWKKIVSISSCLLGQTIIYWSGQNEHILSKQTTAGYNQTLAKGIAKGDEPVGSKILRKKSGMKEGMVKKEMGKHKQTLHIQNNDVSIWGKKMESK